MSDTELRKKIEELIKWYELPAYGWPNNPLDQIRAAIQLEEYKKIAKEMREILGVPK